MSCVEKCQSQNTHVLLLKSSFFFQTKEKHFSIFFGQISVDLPTQFLVHLWPVCALLIFCPTRFETRALSVVETMLNQFIIWTNLENLITEAQQYTELDMRSIEHLGESWYFTGFYNLLLFRELKRRPQFEKICWARNNQTAHPWVFSACCASYYVTAIGQACLMLPDSAAVSLFGNMIDLK